jgi:hypothetical protein
MQEIFEKNIRLEDPGVWSLGGKQIHVNEAGRPAGGKIPPRTHNLTVPLTSACSTCQREKV